MKKYVNNSFVNKSPLEYKNGTEAVTSLPVTLYTDGQPVSSYTIKGNTSTSGTPSPSNPITINGVGEKTANLWSNLPNTTQADVTLTSTNGVIYFSGTSTGNANIATTIKLSAGTYTLKANANRIPSNDNYACIQLYSSSPSVNVEVKNSVATTGSTTFTLNSDTTFSARVRIQEGVDYTGFELRPMLNTGSTALPYEPYGRYKISISSNSTALTPVYLTEQLMKIGDTVDSLVSTGTTTYNIKKLVLTGNETGWTIESGTTYVLSISDQMPTSYANAISTHYILADSYNNLLNTNNTFAVSRRPALFIHDDTLTTVDALKTYLATQYANGTPVTVYYVLETPTTESVTAPTIPTTGGEVSIDVDTTVKPSELDLTYHGWHSHEPLKRENGSWS